MSRRRVSFSPEQTINSKHDGATKASGSGNNKGVVIPRICNKFLKNMGAEFAKALNLVSKRRSRVSSASAASLVRSRSYAEEIRFDSQRAEAIEDCIEFFNSCASLRRSNSVITSSCAYY